MQEKEKYQTNMPENVDHSAEYQGPKKIAEIANLLEGVDNLIAKGNLAKDYRQNGGQ